MGASQDASNAVLRQNYFPSEMQPKLTRRRWAEVVQRTEYRLFFMTLLWVESDAYDS